MNCVRKSSVILRYTPMLELLFKAVLTSFFTEKTYTRDYFFNDQRNTQKNLIELPRLYNKTMSLIHFFRTKKCGNERY